MPFAFPFLFFLDANSLSHCYLSLLPTLLQCFLLFVFLSHLPVPQLPHRGIHLLPLWRADLCHQCIAIHKPWKCDCCWGARTNRVRIVRSRRGSHFQGTGRIKATVNTKNPVTPQLQRTIFDLVTWTPPRTSGSGVARIASSSVAQCRFGALSPGKCKAPEVPILQHFSCHVGHVFL